MAQLFQDDSWLHQPGPQTVFITQVFEVESMLHIIVGLATTVLFIAAPTVHTSEITDSPLDAYSAVRSIKSRLLALEASSDYASGNDIWLADADTELGLLYATLSAKHAVQTVTAALQKMLLVSEGWNQALASYQRSAHQLSNFWRRRIVSSLCASRFSSCSADVEVARKYAGWVHTAQRRTQMNIEDITQLADVGATANFAIAAWHSVSRGCRWQASHNACFHSLRHLMQPDQLHITAHLLAQSATDSAAWVREANLEFKKMPAGLSCVLQSCDEDVSCLGSCPLTGAPKRACSLQHYRMAKQLHSQAAVVSRLQQSAAYQGVVANSLLSKLRPWQLQTRIKLSLRERMEQPNEELATRLAAARRKHPVTGSDEPMPLVLVLDNRATLQESQAEDTQEASDTLVCFCSSCKQYKLLSAFESKTCIQCLSARRTAHAVSNDVSQAFLWTENADQNGSRACMDSHIRQTIGLVAEHANDANSDEAISIAQHWIHLLCAQVAGHKLPKNPQQHDDSEGNKSCSSCRKKLPQAAFDAYKATCRWCLQRRKDLHNLDQQVVAYAQQIWPDHAMTGPQVAQQLMVTFDHVYTELCSMPAHKAVQAVLDLKASSDTLNTGSLSLWMNAAAAELPEPSDWMLVSRSEVVQQCSSLPAVGFDVQLLVDSIFDKQHTLWFALTDSLHLGGALESLPDLSPSMEAGRATKAIYKAAAANACRALSIQVLSSAIEELAPRHIDVSRLQATLNSVRTLPQCEPAIAGCTATCETSDPTLTGSTSPTHMQLATTSDREPIKHTGCTSGDSTQAFVSLRSWAQESTAISRYWYGSCKKARWNLGYNPLTVSAYDAASFTVNELRRRLATAARIPACGCSQCSSIRNCRQLITGSSTPEPMAVPAHVKQAVMLATAQQRARDSFWQLTEEAHASGDFKLASKGPLWREKVLQSHAAVYEAASKPGDERRLRSAARLIISDHPDRAQRCANPTRVMQTTRPAVKDGSMQQSEAQFLTTLAQKGLTVEEFRDFDGPALDLLEGNTEDPEDQQVLLDFYLEHASRGRVLILGPEYQEELDQSGEVVLSPSFLVKVEGKKPRAILNLSSTDQGVNQRMFQAETMEDGYCTIPDVARLILFSLIAMLLAPERFSMEQVLTLVLVMIVMDGEAAFFKKSVNPESVGIQAARIAGYTIFTLCCAFGWARSAEVFSHVTAAVVTLHQSDLDSATLIDASQSSVVVEECDAMLKSILQNVNPVHSHLAIGHVDDLFCLEIANGNRPKAAAADLAWSIMSLLGHDGLSVKKFVASSFWCRFQKVIGAWFNTRTFTVTMPLDKIEEALAIINSDVFALHQSSFPIGLCATLRGKIRWAAYTTPLGDMPCLINIEKTRRVGEPGARKVKPIRSSGESEELTLRKFQNDLLIRKKFLTAAASNPRIASCSMVSVLPVEERLKVPGQSKWLIWLGGDFSVLGQSFGIEYWDADTDTYRKVYSYVAHPQGVLDQLRSALAGNAKKGMAVVSTVLERANVLMAEFMFRDILANRPCIVLDDNQGSVAVQRTGYSRNVLSQAMQLASNLRQAIDEARQTAFYCSTHNMSVYDKISRRDSEFMIKANAELTSLGLPAWEYLEPAPVVHAINNWLDYHWNEPLPMLDSLLSDLECEALKVTMPKCSIDTEELLSKPDLAWQDRVNAAAHPIPHWLGSYGPLAYSTAHIPDPTTVGSYKSTWQDLKRINRQLQHSTECYSAFDAFAGGGGATVSAISAGLFVKSTAEISKAEVARLEDLTGQRCLGDIQKIPEQNMPAVNVFISCSSCKDYAALGSHKGVKGDRGGDLFPMQAKFALGADADALVCENVNGVEHMGALAQLQKNCRKLGFNQIHTARVVFAQHGDPENRARRIFVAFRDRVSAAATTAFVLPVPNSNRMVAGDILLPSTFVHAKFWDDRRWIADLTQWRQQAKMLAADTCIFNLGYMDFKDRVGSPLLPNRIFHMMGLFPTVMASGNTGLVLVLQLRSMCPKYGGFMMWLQYVQRSKQVEVTPFLKAALRLRRVMPSECMDSKGFPAGSPKLPVTAEYRMAGNSVPVPYFTKLLNAVIEYLAAARVQPAKSRDMECQLVIPAKQKQSLRQRMAKPSARLAGMPAEAAKHNPVTGTTADASVNSADPEKSKKKIKSGNNLVHDLNRSELIPVPLHLSELANMTVELDHIAHGSLEDSSIGKIDGYFEHYKSFCARFGLSVYLNTDTLQDIKAASAQGRLFALYELGNFQQKAKSVNAKLWAVDKMHEANNMNPPFAENRSLKRFMSNAMARDKPAIPKVPITQRQMDALEEMLNLKQRSAYTFWIGLRFAICFLCRISEWAMGEKHTVKWKYITFLDAQGHAVDLKSLDQLPLLKEMEVVFWSDKTHTPGTGVVRNWHCIEDLNDKKCLVRDMARLWLMSEQIPELEVFTWDNGTKGVKRAQVCSLLKKAAVKVGIPAADTASHSARITGLSQLMSKGKVPFYVAREWGRWQSDCAKRYWWASADMAKEFCKAIWEPGAYARARGEGEVQRYR
jgi:site-specific DNA-cytosine methylase